METLMVSAIHRGVVKGLALAPFAGLLCTHAFALNRDRTISAFSRTAWTVGEAAPFFHTVWFMLLCIIAAGGLLGLLFAFRLRQLTRQLQARLAERLAERERIARELHDTLLQSMGGLILRFQTATERIPQDDPTRQMLEEALKQSDKVLAEGRERLLGLTSSSSEANDLPEALAAVGHPVVRDQVYRIGREAIANCFQHANAERCETEINFDPTQLRIAIRDDGRGVEETILEAAHRSGGWGMPGMFERASKIGAHLEIWSRPGVGTEIEVRVPAVIAYRSTTNASRWQWLRRLATGGG
jgi:signal transduction histidine kinase